MGRVAFRLPSTKHMAVLIVAVILLASLLPILYFVVPLQHGVVGIIEVNGPITSEDVRDNMEKMASYAAENNSIRAVVLKIDSPGGLVDATQDIYGALLKLREKKPVVSSIVGLGASGAYYLSIAAQLIYVVPSALVGNIGVIGFPPEKVGPFEDVTETGPYKLTGMSRTAFIDQVYQLQREFLDQVKKQRGDKLRLSLTRLSTGEIYFGEQAVKYGLADTIGSSTDAIERASHLAGLFGYSTHLINDLFPSPSRFQIFSSMARNQTASDLQMLARARPPPAFYYLYAPAFHLAKAEASTIAYDNRTMMHGGFLKGTVVVDDSHNNYFQKDGLNPLMMEIVAKNETMAFLEDSKDLDSALSDAKSFVIINPEKQFTGDQISSIRDFSSRGGKLVFIFDPARSVNGVPAQVGIMNSISSRFGIVFDAGYLYNLEHNEGNYRNIVVSDFAKSDLTKGLKRLIFYTSTYVSAKGSGIAFTSHDTESSDSGLSGRYAVMAYISDKKALAIGDHAFLGQPYLQGGDNFKLVQNLVDFLVS